MREGLRERDRPFVVLRREEFERDGRAALPEDFANFQVGPCFP